MKLSFVCSKESPHNLFIFPMEKKLNNNSNFLLIIRLKLFDKWENAFIVSRSRENINKNTSRIDISATLFTNNASSCGIIYQLWQFPGMRLVALNVNTHCIRLDEFVMDLKAYDFQWAISWFMRRIDIFAFGYFTFRKNQHDIRKNYGLVWFSWQKT